MIAQTCNVSPGWLIFGEGPVTSEDDNDENRGRIGEYIEIPYYDIEAYAGNGLTPYNCTEPEMVRISRIFMQKILHIPPENAYIISFSGDSMEPTIRPGARLILDTSPVARLEGVYALTISGYLYIKRLYMAPEKVIISSDNKLYDPIEITREKIIWGQSIAENTVSVLGKVVHVIQPCL